MAAPINPEIFKEALIILGAAAIVIPVFHRLKLSPVLGYMIVGMAVGPSGLGQLASYAPWLDAIVIDEREGIELLAEFGVVFLLFMIGLELSFERLRTLRVLVFGLGTIQLAVSAVLIAGIALMLGQTTAAAITLGLALAMSSTAVVIQVLSEEGRLSTNAGRTSFAILLFQDIAVVPVLFAVSMMGGVPGETSAYGQFGIAIAQAAVAITVLVALGRLLLRPMFRMVAQTRSPELFMAACLLVILGTSLITAVSGLSAAMGALIAGLLLAETEYRRQIEVMVEPFKGLLIGVFLISVGMSLNLKQIFADPLAPLMAVFTLVALKALIIIVAARAFGVTLRAGIQSGLLLGPGGEFGFVVLSVATASSIVTEGAGDFALLVVALTMAVIPMLSKLGNYVASQLPRTDAKQGVMQVPLPAADQPRVIVAGFGRVGRVVASLLDAHKIPYLAVDFDADTVARERKRDAKVYWGDISNLEFMRNCDIAHARALVVTMDNPAKVEQVVTMARAERADLQIIARARDARHAAQLYKKGASHAVPETIEASLQLSEAVLEDVGIPMGLAIASIHEKRAEFRAQVQAAAPPGTTVFPNRPRLRDALSKPGKDQA